MLCLACNVDVHPAGHFTFGAPMVYRCPLCNGGMPSPEQSAETTVASKPGDVDASAATTGQVVRVTPRSAPIAAVPVAAAPPASVPFDILSAARARLEMVREMIASLRQYEAEEAMLERMVAAAGPPPAPRLALAR